jgi:hypothetical protein
VSQLRKYFNIPVDDDHIRYVLERLFDMSIRIDVKSDRQFVHCKYIPSDKSGHGRDSDDFHDFPMIFEQKEKLFTHTVHINNVKSCCELGAATRTSGECENAYGT